MKANIQTLDMSCNCLTALEDVHALSKHAPVLARLDCRNNPDLIEVPAELPLCPVRVLF